ncbi:BON domain-containing protein [Hoeflea sp. YIM 152468]|uniref:BON domain-containing protein n=1 Tax=Hoeflea sp. YIM 152468 TaxID=3031759 RepID=UPI0023DC7545|nr:BON domain-containing protein [Hoeflea sp. YIM 152468]MDF1609373.1 BON domain-containing protein [Hoeflea sp. YIM 152468]
MVYKKREYFGEPADPERAKAAQLEADVAAALAASGKYDAADVEVTVVSGSSIILSGWVTDEAELRRCMETAAAVAGVRHVESAITVRSSPPPLGSEV